MGKKSKKGMSRAGGLKNKKAKQIGLRTGSFKKTTTQGAVVMSKTSDPPVSPTSGAELDLQTLDASKSATLLLMNDSAEPITYKEPVLDFGASTAAGNPSTPVPTGESLTEPSLPEVKETQRFCDCVGCAIL